MWLTGTADQLAVGECRFTDVLLGSAQEEPLALAHVRRCLSLMTSVLHTLALLLSLYDRRLQRLHRAANGRCPPIERQRSNEPVLFVVAAQVTPANWQSLTCDVQDQVTLLRLDIERLSQDRIPSRILELIHFATSVLSNVDLQSITDQDSNLDHLVRSET